MEFLYYFIALLISAYLGVKYLYSYWWIRGFPYLEPTIPMGNLDTIRKRQHSFGIAIYHLYKASKEPFVGIYLMFKPALLVRDIHLVKRILSEDFNSFHDRGVYYNEKSDPISASLFSLTGEKWRNLRAKLTPAFSSGKLKSMFSTVEATGKKLQTKLNKIVSKKGEVVEMREILSRYAVDIIASVIFGIEANSLENENSDFRKISLRLTNDQSLISTLRITAIFLVPGLIKFLNLRSLPKEVADFMIGIVRQTIDYRENSNISRKDLMQLLLQLRNTGKINLDDDIWDVETEAENLKSISIEQIAAQVFIFYIAGTESTSSTTVFCLYEVVRNKVIKEKLEENIRTTLKKFNGELSYDCIQDMKYLDLCINETMRKYPGLPILNRECTKDYQIPDSKFLIKKGTSVIISTMGIHRDENLFPDPLKFDPERFLETNQNYNKNAFLPFGDGPRACIAIRLGKMNVKMGMVMLLTEYDFDPITKGELEFIPTGVGLIPKDGVQFYITKREKSLFD